MTSHQAEAERRRRLSVVEAGHGDDPAEISMLRAALTDPASMVRASALTALARRGALETDELRNALDDTPSVCCRALELIGSRGTDELGREVRALLTHPDSTVVEAAATALGEMHEPHADDIAALAHIATDHPEALCRESAVAALGSLADPEGLPALLHAAGDKPPIRRRAVLALSAFDDPAAHEAIVAALDDKDRHVRSLAGEILGEPVS